MEIAGVPAEDAGITIDVLLRADLRGVSSHGIQIQRLLMYIPRLRIFIGIDPDKPTLIPGEPEAQMQRIQREKGIPFEPKVFETLKGLAQGNYNYEIPRL